LNLNSFDLNLIKKIGRLANDRNRRKTTQIKAGKPGEMWK